MPSKPHRLPGDPHGLTVRQRLFVTYYFENGGNAAEAARAAGYNVNASKATQYRNAKRILKHPDVEAALADMGAKVVPGNFGDLKELMVLRLVQRILDEGPDMISAVATLAKMIPGAIVPQQLQVESKTFPELVLEAQRKREAALPSAPKEPDPAEPQKPE